MAPQSNEGRFANDSALDAALDYTTFWSFKLGFSNNIQVALKVSKFQKQIFFERNNFLISGLPSKNWSNQKYEGSLLYYSLSKNE